MHNEGDVHHATPTAQTAHLVFADTKVNAQKSKELFLSCLEKGCDICVFIK